jgi:porin
MAHGDGSVQAPSPISSPSSPAFALFTESPPTIAANPGASNPLPGTGLLGKLIGFTPESGIRIGGLWVGNSDYLFTGGQKPRTWSFNSLLILNLHLNLDKIVGLPGATVDCSLLQFNGENANEKAGVVQGYDGLIANSPLVRTELYQLLWRQRLFDDKLIVLVGKSVPTVDFNNVSRPVDVSDPEQTIPGVTSLIYTPIFVNPTMLGVAPGYYNSAYGIMANWALTKSSYITYGLYDGALADGVQTGLKEAPVLDGHYFTIGEVGDSWLLGREELPGKIAMGGWVQTGEMYGPDEFQPGGAKPKYQVAEEGAQGAYSLGSQRIWYRNPGIDNSGISAFYQFGFNQSNTMLINRYFGMGATGFGPIPGRISDSIGVGLAWSWLNRRYGFRSNEAMLEGYYQAHLIGSSFIQPAISYIPNPGLSPRIQGAVTATAQLIIQF